MEYLNRLFFKQEQLETINYLLCYRVLSFFLFSSSRPLYFILYFVFIYLSFFFAPITFFWAEMNFSDKSPPPPPPCLYATRLKLYLHLLYASKTPTRSRLLLLPFSTKRQAMWEMLFELQGQTGTEGCRTSWSQTLPGWRYSQVTR